jgi:hypothetical protein
MKLEIQVLGQAHKCGGVKPVNEIPTGIANLYCGVFFVFSELS